MGNWNQSMMTRGDADADVNKSKGRVDRFRRYCSAWKKFPEAIVAGFTKSLQTEKMGYGIIKR